MEKETLASLNQRIKNLEKELEAEHRARMTTVAGLEKAAESNKSLGEELRRAKFYSERAEDRQKSAEHEAKKIEGKLDGYRMATKEIVEGLGEILANAILANALK